jgi:DNA-binding transcriptional LysR family regulator
MRLLQELDIFVRTADNGSLSATARALDLTPAATSAALKRLEGELGVQLFVRSTRTMRLTREGEQYLAQCRPALEVLQQASRDLVTGNQAFQGVVRLSAPSDFGRNLLLPWLDAFQDRHPLVEFRLQLTDRVANIYSDPVDVAFRYGDRRIRISWRCRWQRASTGCYALRRAISPVTTCRKRHMTCPRIAVSATCLAMTCMIVGASRAKTARP